METRRNFLARVGAGAAALTALTPLLAACGDPDIDPAAPTTGAPDPNLAAQLVDTEWLSVGTTDFELVDGSRISITFTATEIQVSAGCNSMFGGYSLDGNLLVVNQLASTEMACDQALMDQDQRLADLLASRPKIEVVGDSMNLIGAGGGIAFLARATADPDRPLEGTSWELDTVITGDAATSWPDVGSALTISDGTASWVFGCNSGSGDVTIDGDAITFGPIGITKMACSGDEATVEQAMLDVVDTWQSDGTPVTWEIEADRLTITNGTAGLSFRATV
jgi:heat shock protein HslJ